MKRLTFSLLLLFSYSTFILAQVNERTEAFPDRAADTATDQARVMGVNAFEEAFSPQPSGILHVYLDPRIDPAEVYLFRGVEASGTVKALLPQKFQRLARRLGGKIYATKAVELSGTKDRYLIRIDGIYEDRIEMFTINDYEVEHVKTLAYRSCLNGKCTQMDTWITDVNGDANAELIQISRTIRDGKTTRSQKKVLTIANNGKWKKSKKLAQDAPWRTIEFYDERGER